MLTWIDVRDLARQLAHVITRLADRVGEIDAINAAYDLARGSGANRDQAITATAIAASACGFDF